MRLKFYFVFVLLGGLLLLMSEGFIETSIQKAADSCNNDGVPMLVNGKRLVWHDEFDIDGDPNPENWNFEYGFVRNQELQWYQPQNATCKNGLLIIEGRQDKIENPNYSPGSGNWRNLREHALFSSSCLITRGLHEWNAGGYYEVRARIDVKSGSWPAIWLLGTDGEWPDNGEIDMMEFYRINTEPYILANVAWGTEVRYQAAWDSEKRKFSDFTERDPDWALKFHTWSMSWSQENIKLFLDGEMINQVNLTKTLNADGQNPFIGSRKFYLLLNLALGANGGVPVEAEMPVSFEVDYVRVYQ